MGVQRSLGADGEHFGRGAVLAGDAAFCRPVAQDPPKGRQGRREVRKLGHVAADAHAADAKLTGKVEGFSDLWWLQLVEAVVPRDGIEPPTRGFSVLCLQPKAFAATDSST